MAELNDHVLDEAGRRGQSLLVRELLVLVERHHPTDEPGVDRELLVEYVDALQEPTRVGFDADEALAIVDEKRSDAERWVDDGTIYAVGEDRVSAFPRRWHDELRGETDLKRYVAVLQEDVSRAFDEGDGGRGRGVPEQTLLSAASAIGPMSREDAKERLEALRADGELVEDADQHPQAGVQLDERTDTEQDVQGPGSE